ncbi:hypothetical protein H4219_002841 [Mycoemilia scoparia]|uniref:FAD/NAD(P)-binding domain-containing protein n=1 Tax=Mycoemilia scoparia TaxID=417184 RepID=A0A9W8A4H6_9FUNG|nr:hypothetical protein H4219_002841 [Mycoemilia scoparia]
MSSSSSSDIVKVVVVGASYAGGAAAQAIAKIQAQGSYKIQVTLVERRDHFMHAVGSLHATVDSKFAPNIFIPIDRIFAAESGKKDSKDLHDDDHHHVIKQGRTLTEVHPHHIVLDDGCKIEFDYLVLATGSSVAAPAKTVSATREDGIIELEGYRNAIEQATKILIVGGGAVGVELAGEIAAKYNEYGSKSKTSWSDKNKKEITLVHNGEHLMPGNFGSALGEDLKRKLENYGVKVFLKEKLALPQGGNDDNADDSSSTAAATAIKVGSRMNKPVIVKSQNGTEFETDLILLAVGNKVNSGYLKTLYQSSSTSGALVDSKTNQILVKDTMQLDDQAFPHIFSVGDVNNYPYTEKYAFKAGLQGETAAKNIEILIYAGYHTKSKLNSNGRDEANGSALLKNIKLKAASTFPSNTAMVPIGPYHGSAQLFGFNVTGCIGDFLVKVTKGKDLFVSKYQKLFGYSGHELATA